MSKHRTAPLLTPFPRSPLSYVHSHTNNALILLSSALKAKPFIRATWTWCKSQERKALGDRRKRAPCGRPTGHFHGYFIKSTRHASKRFADINSRQYPQLQILRFRMKDHIYMISCHELSSLHISGHLIAPSGVLNSIHPRPRLYNHIHKPYFRK